MENQVINQPKWQDKFLEAGTKELGIDCSVLIKTVSDLMISREMAVSLYTRALGDTKFPEEVWKKIANANRDILGIEKKKDSTIEGSLIKLIDSAPKQIEQLNSEIATIEEKGRREHLTPDQIKKMTERLAQERDFLAIPAKYGDVAKPFLKTIDKVASKFLGGLGNG